MKNANGQKETRHYLCKEFRVKRDDAGNARLEGYAAVFDKPSENIGWGEYEVREYIKPGAFADALKESDCRALFNHDSNFILGRESANTLELREDENGLFVGIDLPKTSYAEDLAISVERGDVREQSFCFVVGADEWVEDRENKIATRTITRVQRLYDVGPVVFPAYPDTDIAKRSFDVFRQTATSEADKSATARQDEERKFKYNKFLTSKGLNK